MMMLIAMALLVSLGLWAFVHVAPHWGLVDQPSSRSLHTTPTVVSGGIAPMLVLAAGLYTTMDFPGTQAVALMTLVLTAIGLLDDRHGLPSGVRFLCYLATGLLLCWLLLPAGSASITLLVMAGVADGCMRGESEFILPDLSAANCACDLHAAEMVYRRCQELHVTTFTLCRSAVEAASLRAFVYDELAMVGHPVASRLRESQGRTFDELWRKASLPPGTPAASPSSSSALRLPSTPVSIDAGTSRSILFLFETIDLSYAKASGASDPFVL